MQLKNIEIDCQYPANRSFINFKHSIVQCSISKNSVEYKMLLKRAGTLANAVNPAAANASDFWRDDSRLLQDSFGGVLAEEGWMQYLNTKFSNVASPTPFTQAMSQIDIRLLNGELAEVRSSFPRNGVKFGICSEKANFNNIGPYSNSVKPGEIQKHFYLGVLFDTQKDMLLSDEQVVFSLVGGSTWKMMVEVGRDVDLVPDGGVTKNKSTYRVIKFKDALDALGVIDTIESSGYVRTQNP
ncbi:MAG: hypothetical protein HHJ12_00845 [Glaciimonas sp.]|nr:hypothetical protein [Glaciimonas sp.]